MMDAMIPTKVLLLHEVNGSMGHMNESSEHSIAKTNSRLRLLHYFIRSFSFLGVSGRLDVTVFSIFLFSIQSVMISYLFLKILFRC